MTAIVSEFTGAGENPSKPTGTGAEHGGWLRESMRKAAVNYLRFESAKTKVASYASPLLNLVPGIGPLTAAGIGALSNTMSKLYTMAADGLEGKDDITADKVADTIIADAKESLPGLLAQGGKANIGKLVA